MSTLNARLNKRERRAQQLLAHYATCERLATYLANLKECPKCGNVSTNTTCPKCVVPQRFNGRSGLANIDGKKISVALFKLERRGQARAARMCNDYDYTQEQQDIEQDSIYCGLSRIFAAKVPPGYFLNSDPRGYALKIDNEVPEGLALIRACELHTDMGGFGILSPEITGEA